MKSPKIREDTMSENLGRPTVVHSLGTLKGRAEVFEPVSNGEGDSLGCARGLTIALIVEVVLVIAAALWWKLANH